MRRPLLFGVIFGLTLFGSFNASAEEAAQTITAADLRWQVLAVDEKVIIDRMAADFFEGDLRQAQARRIEAATAEIYAALPIEERQKFRNERRRLWRLMDAEQRRALRGVKTPRFYNLAEAQKQPYRRIAFDRLKAAGAINHQALTAALRREI